MNFKHECHDPAECWFYWVGLWIGSGDEIPERNDTIMNELYDYHFLLSGLSEFYDEITGGRITKPNTEKFEVVNVVNQRIEEAYMQGWEDQKEDHECVMG